MKYNEHHLETRDHLAAYFNRFLQRELGKINPAFQFMRIESPILLPFSANRTKETVQIRLDNEDLILRENTVTGAYEASRDILTGKAGTKKKLPIVVWQRGKIFERSKGKVKEHYNLEFQILFSKTTGMPYDNVIAQSCQTMLGRQCGTILTTASPGLIHYATEESHIALVRSRDDFWSGNNIEVAINLDACAVAAMALEKTASKTLTASS